MEYEYKEIKTYAINAGIDSNYKEINDLVKGNIENGTLPFMADLQLPPDMNVITGNTCMDVNSEKISQKAASIGATSTMWIYGADAEFLGLELKSNNPSEFAEMKKKNPGFNCSPFVVQRVRERFNEKDMAGTTNVVAEGMGVDAQCAYLLDQFTEKSIERLFTQRRLENKLEMNSGTTRSRAELIANQILKHRMEYNTGANNEEHIKNVRQNLYLNLAKGSPVLSEVAETRNMYFKNYLPEQKVIFDFYYKNNNNKAAEKQLYQFSKEDKDTVKKAMESLLKKMDGNPKMSGALTRTIFDAYLFSQRLTHHNFSLDPIFTREDQRKAVQNLEKTTHRLPQGQQVRQIIDQREKERYKRSRGFNMSVGAGAGM